MNTVCPLSTTGQREIDLLLNCARVHVPDEVARHIAQLADPAVDWVRFVRLAISHGVITLCHRHLAYYCPERVPAEVLDRLALEASYRARYGLYQLSELCRLSRVFSAHQIPVLPMKGPVFSVLLYQDATLREASDLDFLLHEQDMGRVRTVLQELGYEPYGDHEGAEHHADEIRGAYYHDVFRRPDTNTKVEMHWQVAEQSLSRSFSDAAMWAHCQPLVIGSVTMRTMAPADMLLSSCVHGTRHGWYCLKWICDIAEFVRVYPDLDWHALLATARAQGNTRVLLLALYLAYDLLGAAVPPDVLAQAREDRVIPALATGVRERLPLAIEADITPLDIFLFQLRVKERFRDRVRVFTQRMIQPAEGDWVAMPLPPALFFLYPLIRPFRLLRRYGLSCLRALFRQSS